MPRTIPAHRFDDLVRHATEVFIAHGYRRTQMADVAKAIGVSKATLYLYVESKEALFALCYRHAGSTKPIAKPDVLPVPNPAPGALAADLKQRLDAVGGLPRLARSLGRPRAEDIHAELREILEELYDVLETNCRGIKLIDRCLDHPELGAAWQAAGREQPRAQLAEYIQLRAKAGQIRAGTSARLLARLIIETTATWAMHIKWDASPEPFEPISTRAGVIEYIARGLLSDAAIHQGTTRHGAT